MQAPTYYGYTYYGYTYYGTDSVVVQVDLVLITNTKYQYYFY